MQKINTKEIQVQGVLDREGNSLGIVQKTEI